MQHGERTWPETERDRGKVVVAPLGSLEQHGHHLPLLTDSLIIGEIARRAEEEVGDEARFLPVLWLGASDHHLGFAGTVSASNDHYALVLADVLESLIRAGFRRILLLNGHGGNITPGRQALYNVHLRHPEIPDLFLAFSSWWQIAEPSVNRIPDLQARMVTHACEQETSMVLRIRPDLVRMEAAEGTTISFESDFYVPDFSAPGRVDVPRAFDQISRTGAFGRPELATPEKGEALLHAAASEVARFIREFARWSTPRPH